MARPHPWILVWFCCLGCHSVIPIDRDDEQHNPGRLWEQGQARMLVFGR